MGDWSTIELIRAAYCGTLALSFLILLPGNCRFVTAFGEHLPGLRLLGFITVPRLAPSVWLGISLLFAVSIILCGAGCVPQLTALIALVCYFLCFDPLAIVDTAKRKTFSIPVVLTVFALEPWISPDWLVLILQAIACQVLVSSGLQKIRHAGFRNWLSGRAMRSSLLRESLLFDARSAGLIAANPMFCRLLATVVLVFEIGFVAVLFAPAFVVVALVAGAVAFHFVIWRVMKINYLPFHGPVYWAFLPAFLELAGKF